MQELRFVAVSEDGSYALLAVPGRSGRYILPIDERLRAVALGQTSRLAQYEIEVESPLRPKEIQARIRAGETAEEIADAAGIPVERVRWFEGPVLAERAYIADQAQAASVRRAGEAAGPGSRLGEVVPARLSAAGADPEDAQWDSRKRGDGNWQVTLTFPSGGRLHTAEWVFDPRRRHVLPDDDNAARLSLPESELPALPVPVPGEATVTPIAPRLGAAAGMGAGGGTFAGPGHAGNGFGGSRFRPERSVIPDRSLGTDRTLAADRTHAPDRSRTPDRPAAGGRPPVQEPAAAPERTAAADYGLPDDYPMTDYIASAEQAALAEHPVTPDRPSLAYSPAATPVLPRPVNQAQEPAPPRHVVFEDPEPTVLDEQLEFAPAGHPAAEQAGPAATDAPPAAEPVAAAAEPVVTVAEPVAMPEPVAEPPGAKSPVVSPAAVTPAEVATAAAEPAADDAKLAEPEADTAAEMPAAEDQSAGSRPGKKNARGRRSSVPSWDEIMLGSSRQRD